MNYYKPSTAAPLLYNIRRQCPGLSVSRVTELCRAGRLGQRVGKGWLITDEDIARFNEIERKEGRPVKSI